MALASGARAGVRLVSVERDPERARLATEVFADRPEVEVITGDWRRIGRRTTSSSATAAAPARAPATPPPTRPTVYRVQF